MGIKYFIMIKYVVMMKVSGPEGAIAKFILLLVRPYNG
jgi:hypothetical protein